MGVDVQEDPIRHKHRYAQQVCRSVKYFNDRGLISGDCVCSVLTNSHAHHNRVGMGFLIFSTAVGLAVPAEGVGASVNPGVIIQKKSTH